jgi:hypothetical protein
MNIKVTITIECEITEEDIPQLKKIADPANISATLAKKVIAVAKRGGNYEYSFEESEW